MTQDRLQKNYHPIYKKKKTQLRNLGNHEDELTRGVNHLNAEEWSTGCSKTVISTRRFQELSMETCAGENDPNEKHRTASIWKCGVYSWMSLTGDGYQTSKNTANISSGWC